MVNLSILSLSLGKVYIILNNFYISIICIIIIITLYRAKQHHEGSITDEQLEADYWKLIKSYSAESPSVEYGNDLSTHEYNSGFLQRLVK